MDVPIYGFNDRARIWTEEHPGVLFLLGIHLPSRYVAHPIPLNHSESTNTFPAWMIASFLPLPPIPKMGPEMMEVNDDVEMALESQLLYLQQRRHDNARWWRYLNRWMISLGVAIIVIIVSSRSWILTIASLTIYNVDHNGCDWHHKRLLIFPLSWGFSSALTSLSTTLISISYVLRTRTILSPNSHAFTDTFTISFSVQIWTC